MSQQTGYQVRAFFAPDYAGIIQGMRFDKVESPGTATRPPWKRWIAPTARSSQTVAASGAPGYWSLLIANKGQQDRTASRTCWRTPRA